MLINRDRNFFTIFTIYLFTSSLLAPAGRSLEVPNFRERNGENGEISRCHLPQTAARFSIDLAMFRLTLFVQTQLDFLSFCADLSASSGSLSIFSQNGEVKS